MASLSQIDGDLHVAGQISCQTMLIPSSTVVDDDVAANANIAHTKVRHLHAIRYSQANRQTRHFAKSRNFNLDNGSGTTIDDVILKHAKAITIVAARIVYTTETTGTVAGGSAKVGTTLNGAEIVAATNYENSKAVGTQTNMTIVSGAVAAGGAVFVRHTGVAATQAGEAYVEIEYTINEENEVVAATVPIHSVRGTTGTIVGIEAMAQTAPVDTFQFTVDLKKGNQSTAFASVLTGVITYTSAKANREVVAGTLSATSLADGDSLQLAIAVSGTTGTQAKDIVVVVWVAEDPQ